MKNPGEIHYACIPCGEKAMEQANIAPTSSRVVSSAQGKCDACGATCTIAHVSTFGHAFTKRAAQVAHWT